MHPVELREKVTSPGGTTIRAVRELEQAGVRAAFLNAIQAAMDKILDKVQHAVDRGVDKLAGKMDQYATFATLYAQKFAQQAQQGPVAVKPDRDDPRTIMCFGINEELTAEKIKERKRELAKIVHIDKGGNDEAMARINAAADALLAKL